MYELYMIDAEGKVCAEYAPVHVPEAEIAEAYKEALRWMGAVMRTEGWQLVTRFLKVVN